MLSSKDNLHGRILVIYNPESGSTTTSGANEIRDIVRKYSGEMTLKKVKTPPEVETYLKKVHVEDYTALAVYAGDGTVLATLKAASTIGKPVIILPGGTGNALASDLDMPTGITDTLEMYYKNHYIVRHVDIATANGVDFALDLHYGIWAKAIVSTPRTAKQKFGRVAYAWSLINTARYAKKDFYELQIDGQTIALKGYALMVANGGYQSILGVPLFPYPHGRGLLQVAIVRSVNGFGLMRWYWLRRLGRKQVKSVVATYSGNRVKIIQAPNKLIFDDDEQSGDYPLLIENSGRVAMVITPAPQNKQTWYKRLLLTQQLFFSRLLDRTRRRVSGQPYLEYSQIAPGILVGGQYRKGATAQFHTWGVTGIVSMRKSKYQTKLAGIDHLSLPTQDWKAPTLDALERGVNFIQEKRLRNEAVYIHCRLGEGRGPTMAAAYLISRGLTAAEAVDHVRRFRPMAYPSREQLRQLNRFQEKLYPR